MKVILVIVAIVIVALVVLALLRLFQAGRAALQKREERNAEWEIDERGTGNGLALYLIKVGETEEHFETIPTHIPQYEYEEQLIEARLRAQEICDARNRRLNA